MTEQEISVKLTETEQRAKSNTHRIEKLEQQQKDLNKLVTAVEVLASREKGVETDVKEIKADVKTITQKGGKRWDAMIDRVLYVLIGAAISLLMTGGAYEKETHELFQTVAAARKRDRALYDVSGLRDREARDRTGLYGHAPVDRDDGDGGVGSLRHERRVLLCQGKGGKYGGRRDV